MNHHLSLIAIQNFQSHKDTLIELHPGVNAIVGPTDAGKSSIFRLIRWITHNRPLGDNNRSTWGGRTLGELEFADGVIVGRETDAEKIYYVGNDEFKAFNKDVPEEVVKALDLSEINFQNQFDQPFLISASSGDVAKTLNRIANLTKIDTSVSNIKKMVQDNRDNIKSTERKIKELKEDQGKFAYLEQMERDVRLWERLTAELAQVQQSIFTLTGIVEAVTEDEKTLDVLDSFLTAEKPLTQALTLVEEEKDVDDEIASLAAVITAVERQTEYQKGVDQFLKAEPELLKALELIAELDKVQQEGSTLQAVLKEMQAQSILLDSGDIALQQLEDHFKRLMPKQCTKCPLFQEDK